MAGIAQVTKISLTSFDPKRLLGLPKDGPGAVKELALGVILGRATKVVSRTNPAGDGDFIGLGGVFEARFNPHPADGTIADPLGSGICYMPEAFQNPIIDLLTDIVNEKGEVTKPGAESVAFIMEVSAIRAGNPQGYSWKLRPLNDPAPGAYDPLEVLRADLPAAMKALAAPVKDATDETADKGGKKTGK